MGNLDLADPVLTLKTLIDNDFSNTPVALSTGDTRGGYAAPTPQVIPIEGEAGKRTKKRLSLRQVPELALIRLYEVSDTTMETSWDEKFGDRQIIVSIEMTSWESKARLWELFLEIQRIVYKNKVTPGGNYRYILPRDRVPKIHEMDGVFQYVYDVAFVKVGDYLGD